MTLENKKNTANIRYCDGVLYFGTISMKALLPDKHHDRNEYVRKSLESDICYSRIVSRIQHSKRRFFLQLVLLGTPPRNITRACSGRVGMDIGPSSYAAWSPESATTELAPLAPEVRDVRKKFRRNALRQNLRTECPLAMMEAYADLMARQSCCAGKKTAKGRYRMAAHVPWRPPETPDR